MIDRMATKVAANTLADWILEEMATRDMSQRKFAELVGVSHATLDRILRPKREEDKYPSVQTLIKMSRKTGTDLCTLIALVSPEDAHIDAEARVIAQRIAALPPDKQSQIDTFLLGLALQGRDKG